MRTTLFGIIAVALLGGCGSKYKPGTAVIDGWDRTRAFSEDRPSTVQYTGYAMVGAPVIPVMAFGAAFDLDLVVKTKSDDWDMHEWARISTPDGPLWLALDSRTGSLDQVVIADIPDIDTWMPEVPVERVSSPLSVVDRSTNDELDITISYTNPNGEEVEVEILGDPPHRTQEDRNGNTLGHSANSALAVLDIPHRESLFKASVKYNGRPVKMQKIAGLVPFQFAMEQVQGGLATGRYFATPGEVRPLESDWPTPVLHAAMSEAEEAPVEEAAAEAPEANPLIADLQAHVAGAVAECWTTATAENAELAGRMMVSWNVVEGATDGDPVIALDELENEALATCVTDALKAVSWSEGIDGNAAHAFVFAQGEGLVFEADEASEDEGAAEEAEAPAEEEAAAEAPAEDALPEAEEALPEAEADGDDAADGEEDLLGDDEEEEAAPQEGVIYNGIADFQTMHTMMSGNQVELHWDVEHQGDRVVARQVSPMRTLTYEYLVHYDSLELSDITVQQYGRGVPVVHVDINPALPDLRRPFSGSQESRYVIDVNGQGGYATGTIQTGWTTSGPTVKVIPDEPDWTASGVLMSQIIYHDGGIDVTTQKLAE